MDDVRLGLVVRAVRRRQRWRQLDVAHRAGVPQSTVSELERGQVEHLRLGSTRRIATALGIRLDLDARWHGAELAQLLDRDHAALVDRIVTRLPDLGWEVVTEYGFNHVGERGSVDVLAWHDGTRTLLIVEVKTSLPNLQALRRSDDRKRRLVPSLVAAERCWQAVSVGQLLIVADGTTNRRAVERHAATFAAAYPSRGRTVQHWLRAPVGPLSGIVFMSIGAGGHKAAPPVRRHLVGQQH